MSVARCTVAVLVLLAFIPLASCVDYNTDDYWAYYDYNYIMGGAQQTLTPFVNYTSGDVFPDACNSTYDCILALNEFAVCVYVDELNDNRCACDKDIGYTMVNGGSNCSYGAELGELCITDTTTCSETGASCIEDGTNTGQRRCLCTSGYVTIRDDSVSPATYTCEEIIHKRLDPTCELCEKNEGTCYDNDGDGLKNGCWCPISRSGANCQTSNAKVICDVGNFTMFVCYAPHDNMNFSAGAIIHVDGITAPACSGFEPGAGDPHCDADEYKLVLPLEDGEREQCATNKITPDVSKLKYENTLAVHQDPATLTLDDVIFKTYCSFEKFSDGSFQALGVISINRNDRGQHKAPTISLSIENLLGKEIPRGVSLRLGDKIRMRIKLKDDGTYSAIRVLRCTASTKPTVPDPKAITIPLLVNSCPYTRQRILNYKNTWSQVTPAEVQTGAVTVFKMAQGKSVHLHCAIKLCLTGSETECAPTKCKVPHDFAGYGRKKRDVDDDDREERSADYWDDSYVPETTQTGRQMDVMVSREYFIMDEDSEDNVIQGQEVTHPPYLLIVLGIVVILVFMLVLVAVVLFRRLTRQITRHAVDDDDSTSTLTSDTDATPYTLDVSGKRGRSERNSSSSGSSGFGSPGSVGYNTSSDECMIMRDTPENKLMTSC